MLISTLKENYHLIVCKIPYTLQFLIPDEIIIKSRFKRKFRRDINLQCPSTFNEKIQWIKLYDRDPLMTQYADKYTIREVVEKKVGRHVLNNLYGVFENPDEIDFDSFPKSFVLKATHGCSWNIIVKDKSKINEKRIRKKIKKWMSTNYYLRRKEWAYKNIPPRIICERYLESNCGILNDYKLFCFNGNPLFIQVDLDRYTEHKRVFYDTKWNRFDFSLRYPIYEKDLKPPDSLNDMIEIARILSSNFTFARIDMYDLNGQPVFGEVTFYPGAGENRFSPQSYDLKFGSLLKLPKVKNKKNQ